MSQKLWHHMQKLSYLLQLAGASRIQFVNFLDEILAMGLCRLHQVILLTAEDFCLVKMPTVHDATKLFASNMQ